MSGKPILNANKRDKGSIGQGDRTERVLSETLGENWECFEFSTPWLNIIWPYTTRYLKSERFNKQY